MGNVNIYYRVGDNLVAVEDRQYLPPGSSSRVPNRLVVKARIEWISASAVHVCLPPSQVVVNGQTIVLPKTAHRLRRDIEQTSYGSRSAESGSPSEWQLQPFYPKIAGQWCAAKKASYFNEETWAACRHFFNDAPRTPRDIALERCARLLGIDANATRKEISDAFRVRVKQVHPDFGGSAGEFQRLLAARNSLLVKSSRV